MRTKRVSTLNPKATIAWTIVLAASFFSFYFGATNIFEDGSFRMVLRDKWPWLLMTAAGIFFMLIAIWQLSADQIGGVSAVFARLWSRRIGPIYHYIPQSIHSNTRNAKNLMGFLTLGVALVTGLMVMSDTIQLGNTAQNHSYLGGDIVVFNPMIPRSSLQGIRGLPGIESATTYTGVVMESWKYNFGTEYSYVVNKADGYGGRNTNLNVIVIEPDEYLAMNPPGSAIHNEFSDVIPSIYEIDKPDSFEDPPAFIHRLDQSMSAIVGTPLLATLGKDVGDTVTVSINGFVGDLEIVGAARNLPAVPYMRLMDYAGYMTRSLVISRVTFEAMLSGFVGNVDIMIKNMTLPERLLNRSNSGEAAGYASGMINMMAINSTIYGVKGVDKVAYRFSTFAPGAPSLNATFNSSQLVWKHKNVGASNGDEFPLPLRAYVVNGLEDIWITGSQERVSEAMSWLNNNFAGDSVFPFGPRNHVASEVLYTIDHNIGGNRPTLFGNTSACVTNRYVVAYEDVDNETYVYEMKPGNLIKFSLPMDDNTTRSFNFTVAATLDNQLAYWWQNGSMREGFKLSSKSLNYNFKENESSDLQDLFDLDANVFLTTRNEMKYMAIQLFGALAQFIGIDELGGIPADEIANHVQIKVKPGFDVSQVAGWLRGNLTGNYSVFEYKRAFVDKLANTGALAVNIFPGTTETAALSTLETWFESNGYTWNVAHVGTLARQNLGSDISIAPPLFRIFFVVAIFSLVINAIGLCTILYANARKRHREYGIYKALGYTNKAIREMIFFETFLVVAIGIIAGVAAGISMMYVLYQAIKSTLVIPMLFSIPIWTISFTVAALIIIGALTSEAISKHVARLSIVDNIRYRE
jgi:ABC-type antimicrobial peptide transport system permease subunit